MHFDQSIDALRAVADPIRYRLLALCSRGQMSVGELVMILGQSQPSISRHLRILANAGLIERYRDGKFMYYRVPDKGTSTGIVRTLLSLTAADDPQLTRDADAVARITEAMVPRSVFAERQFNRAVLSLAAQRSVGALLDVGMGNARIMKLLASSASRLVGVDNDRTARTAARRSLAAAGLANCSVLAGDMYQLPFDHAEFRTVVMDEVLLNSDAPGPALTEAARTLEPNGRLLIFERFQNSDPLSTAEEKIRAWLADTGLNDVSFEQVSSADVSWLLAAAQAA